MRPMRSGGGSCMHGTSKVNQVLLGEVPSTAATAQKEDQAKQHKHRQGDQAN